jgi:hypothetical protein
MVHSELMLAPLLAKVTPAVLLRTHLLAAVKHELRVCGGTTSRRHCSGAHAAERCGCSCMGCAIGLSTQHPPLGPNAVLTPSNALTLSIRYDEAMEILEIEIHGPRRRFLSSQPALPTLPTPAKAQRAHFTPHQV